jgi:hypothetical protein
MCFCGKEKHIKTRNWLMDVYALTEEENIALADKLTN